MRNSITAGIIGLMLLTAAFVAVVADNDKSQAKRDARYEALVTDCMKYGYPRFRCELKLYALR